MRLAREPLFHFILIGAAIYGLYAIAGAPGEADDERAITVSAGEIQWMVDSWTSRWNRPPTQEEIDGVLRGYIREQVLAKEAVAMGLDKDDTVIRRRLAQRLEFLSRDLLTPTNPDPQVLQDWFNTNLARYREPVRYTVTHIYLDPDQRDAQALTDAESIRDALNNLDDVPDDLSGYGDPFMLQSHFPEYSDGELAKAFGGGFVDTLVDLEPGHWHGPVLSGYGVHVVLVSERRVPPEPVYAEVAEQVLQDWTDETSKELTEQFVTNLIDRYEIDVEETSVLLLDPEAARGAAEIAAASDENEPGSEPPAVTGAESVADKRAEAADEG